MQLNFGAREATIKLVYYGPALSGKTTNLKALHQLTKEDSRGRLMTLETKDDRTLFFDMLPVVLRGSGPTSMTLRLKVFTVPGQVIHASTRKLVLQGADGVAFIADAQTSESPANAAAFVDLRDNLKGLGLDMKDVPLVIQFNKMDLPTARPAAEIEALARRGREPVFRGAALSGKGVLETFFGLLYVTWDRLEREHQLSKMAGIEPGGFLPMAARQMGYAGDVNKLLRACVGGQLDHAGAPEGGSP